jgi:hypothetical protein
MHFEIAAEIGRACDCQLIELRREFAAVFHDQGSIRALGETAGYANYARRMAGRNGRGIVG